VKPRVVVLSAPSGGGKTTIAHALVQRFPNEFGFSVSATTRKPRVGEEEGRAYFFLTRQEFLGRRDAGEFLEWAEYAGELYGTLKGEVERVRKSGRHVLLDIEVDGAEQVRKQDPKAITIFILPSQPRVLIERLLNRASESPAEIRQRIERAKYELGMSVSFDRFVRNDDLQQAVDDVAKIVRENGDFGRDAWALQWINRYAQGLQEEAQRLYDKTHQEGDR
jgi:guanylate kinase